MLDTTPDALPADRRLNIIAQATAFAMDRIDEDPAGPELPRRAVRATLDLVWGLATQPPAVVAPWLEAAVAAAFGDAPYVRLYPGPPPPPGAEPVPYEIPQVPIPWTPGERLASIAHTSGHALECMDRADARATVPRSLARGTFDLVWGKATRPADRLNSPDPPASAAMTAAGRHYYRAQEAT